MKVCAISDLHGNLNFDVKESNILCICGDTVPLRIQGYSKDSKKWYEGQFLDWCNNQPVEKVYLIGGNHDKYAYNHDLEFRGIFKGTKVCYLRDESDYYTDSDGNSFLIYGSPWCHQFGNWAFMGYSDEGLENIFMKMPEGTDILLTHDCPYGYGDICRQNVSWNKGEHIGNKGLVNAILSRKPRYNFTGHLHTVDKFPIQCGDTIVQNVSVLNENYDLTFQPTYVEISPV